MNGAGTHFAFRAHHNDQMHASLTNDALPAQSVCVLELPAEVDAARSVAVRSNGLLAIRMLKLPA